MIKQICVLKTVSFCAINIYWEQTSIIISNKSSKPSYPSVYVSVGGGGRRRGKGGTGEGEIC